MAITFFTATIAVFTGVLAIVTAMLWRETRRAAQAAEASANVARDALTKLERPYVFVLFDSTFEHHHEKGTDIAETELRGASLRYDVANYGKTAAIVENVSAIISITKGADPEPPMMVDESHSLLARRVMPPGEVRSDLREHVPVDAVVFDFSNEDSPVPELAGEQRVYFRVVITYHGPFTAGHETSACWRYQANQNRFVPLYNAPEFNYTK